MLAVSNTCFSGLVDLLTRIVAVISNCKPDDGKDPVLPDWMLGEIFKNNHKTLY